MRSIYWTWLRMGEKNYISKVESTLQFSIFCRFIKPHIDSVKVLSIYFISWLSLTFPSSQFCGDVIVGLSLLSPCVMVYQHETDTDRWIHALLPPLSLYIMRYNIASYSSSSMFNIFCLCLCVL